MVGWDMCHSCEGHVPYLGVTCAMVGLDMCHGLVGRTCAMVGWDMCHGLVGHVPWLSGTCAMVERIITTYLKT